MLQIKGMGHLFLVISVSLLLGPVFSADPEPESNDINQHQFHSTSVKHKDGSTSDATSSATTGKLPSSGTNSIPELLRRFNIQGFNFPGTKDTATSASSVTNSIASATNNNGGTPPTSSAFHGYNYPEPPNGPPGPPGIPPGYPPFIPWGIIPGFGADFKIIKIVEKVILVIGGGILLLVILAVLKGSIAKGGFLNNFGLAFSKAFSGAGTFDAGPFHVSAASAAAASSGPALVNDPNFNQRVMDGAERRF